MILMHSVRNCNRVVAYSIINMHFIFTYIEEFLEEVLL